jgi:hypothetical protein
VARIIALIPDLLFGSKVVSGLQAAGHQVELRGDFDDAGGADLLIVDLTSEAQDRIARLNASPTPKLAFYSHVEAEVRRQAEAAGFDLVVPRSRMAREGPALVGRLLSAP